MDDFLQTMFEKIDADEDDMISLNDVRRFIRKNERQVLPLLRHGYGAALFNESALESGDALMAYIRSIWWPGSSSDQTFSLAELKMANDVRRFSIP